MTAGPDDARAVALGILSELRMQPSGHQRLIGLITAALTEARIQGARDALKAAPHLDELTALSQEMGLYGATALSEARDQGARDRDDGILSDLLKDYVSALKFANWPDAKIEKLPTVKRVRAALAAPSPAIAPLREAVVDDAHAPGGLLKDVRKASDRAAELGLPVNRFTGRPCDHSYVRNTSGAISEWVCDLCGNKLDDLAKAAQGAAAEERTP